MFYDGPHLITKSCFISFFPFVFILFHLLFIIFAKDNRVSQFYSHLSLHRSFMYHHCFPRVGKPKKYVPCELFHAALPHSYIATLVQKTQYQKSKIKYQKKRSETKKPFFKKIPKCQTFGFLQKFPVPNAES